MSALVRTTSVQIGGVMMEGRDPAHARAPRVEPYRFPSKLVEEIAIAQRLDLNVMLVGPAGSGKTSLPIQIAARLGIPCVRFNCNGETRVAHLRGQQRPTAQDGVLTLAFAPGLLAAAMRGGWWVVLDELDAAPPPVLFVLQPVLEEGRRSLDVPETGERVEAHPDFRVFATGNTIGFRARSRAKHAGTNAMNTALVDRFGMLLEVAYPSRVEENEILKLHAPKLAAQGPGAVIIDGVCRVAEKLRSDDRFRSDFSTRRCIQWVRLIEQFPVSDHTTKRELPWDVLRAAQLAVLRKFESPTDAKVAYEMVCRTFEYPDPNAAKAVPPAAKAKP
jgi:cobaltochelatase CobS